MTDNETTEWVDENMSKKPTLGLMVERYEDIKEEEITWLWKNRIAVGKLNIFGGNAGLNKSTLTLAIASTVTLGARWPDSSECLQGDVIIMSSEDDAGDTIKPRLRLAGADMNRVHNLSMVSDLGEDGKLIRATFSFMRHLLLLDEHLSNNPQIRLIVVDPIAAFTSGMKNPFDAGEVRGAMAPVIDLLSRHKVAMVALMHLNKAEGMSALNRFSGSGAWTQVARSVWFIDRDAEETMRRVFLPVKVNIGPDTFGNSFDVEIHEDHPVVSWLPDPVEMTADEHLGLATHKKKEKKIDYACKWLKDLLSGGALPPLEVKEKSEAHGIKPKTLRDAKEALCVESVRKGFGKEGKFYWRLPAGTFKTPIDDPITSSTNLGIYDENDVNDENTASIDDQNSENLVNYDETLTTTTYIPTKTPIDDQIIGSYTPPENNASTIDDPFCWDEGEL